MTKTFCLDKVLQEVSQGFNLKSSVITQNLVAEKTSKDHARFFGQFSADQSNLCLKIQACAEDLCVQNKFFVLKSHDLGEAKKLEQISLFTSELNSFAYGQFQTPKFILSVDGKIYYEFENKLYTCQIWIDGDSGFNWLEPNWHSGHCASASKLLANFHAISSLLLASDRLKEIRLDNYSNHLQNILVDFGLVLNTVFSQINSQANGNIFFKKKSSKSTSDTFVALNNLCVQIKSISGSHFVVEQAILLHGDFHPGNLVFREKKAVAIIDWDYVFWGPSEFELAYALEIWSSHLNRKVEKQEFSSSHFNSFIGGYLYGQKALHVDRATLFAYRLRARLFIVYWLLKEVSSVFWANLGSDIYIEKLWNTLEYFANQEQEI